MIFVGMEFRRPEFKNLETQCPINKTISGGVRCVALKTGSRSYKTFHKMLILSIEFQTTTLQRFLIFKA